MNIRTPLLAVALGACATAPSPSSLEADRLLVAGIDTAYQAAVQRNDAQTMANILHEDMILVVGAGTVFTREDLLQQARTQESIYEYQVEDEGTQTVRMYGPDVAIEFQRRNFACQHNLVKQAIDREAQQRNPS